MSYLYGWLASSATFLAFDAIWLGYMTSRFYRPALGDLLADKPRLGVAVVFYLLYVAGLLLLAVIPAVERGSLARAAMVGAITGLMAYGTYDLTNHATLRGWPWQVTLVDMTWGTFLSSVAACAGYLALRLVEAN